MNEELRKNPDGSITLCCRKNRCPVLSQESENTFKIVDDFDNSALFERKMLENAFEKIQLQESKEPDFLDEEFLALENNDGTKVLLTPEQLQIMNKALETFDE